VPKTEQLNQWKFQAADATSLIMVNAPFRKRGRRSGEIENDYTADQVGKSDDAGMAVFGTCHSANKT